MYRERTPRWRVRSAPARHAKNFTLANWIYAAKRSPMGELNAELVGNHHRRHGFRLSVGVDG
jgi:hypothetical protein